MENNVSASLASIIETSVQNLDAFLKAETKWLGRENEVVNLFALRFLAKHVRASGPLKGLDQVGIEVAVPQVTGSVKQYVRKDLVIWPEPGITALMNKSIPAAIVEWKVNNEKQCSGDIKWLKLFKQNYPKCLTYSVCAFIKNNRGCRIEWQCTERVA